MNALERVNQDTNIFLFNHRIKRSLEKMNNQSVQATTSSGEDSVDVVADIELGITSVREVVQIKRRKRAIQSKDLDALRGSFYRFNAVRGATISTSCFSKGIEEAAIATGTAPITLIDGDKMIAPLIEHGIGIKKNKIEVLSLDAYGGPHCPDKSRTA